MSIHGCPSCVCGNHRLPSSLAAAAPTRGLRRWTVNLEAALAQTPDCGHQDRPQLLKDGTRKRTLCGPCSVALIPQWARSEVIA